MFEITYYNASPANTLPYSEKVDVETLLDYLKEGYEGYMSIVGIRYMGKELNINSLYKSLKFR